MIRYDDLEPHQRSLCDALLMRHAERGYFTTEELIAAQALRAQAGTQRTGNFMPVVIEGGKQ